MSPRIQLLSSPPLYFLQCQLPHGVRSYLTDKIAPTTTRTGVSSPGASRREDGCFRKLSLERPAHIIFTVTGPDGVKCPPLYSRGCHSARGSVVGLTLIPQAQELIQEVGLTRNWDGRGGTLSSHQESLPHCPQRLTKNLAAHQ